MTTHIGRFSVRNFRTSARSVHRTSTGDTVSLSNCSMHRVFLRVVLSLSKYVFFATCQDRLRLTSLLRQSATTARRRLTSPATCDAVAGGRRCKPASCNDMRKTALVKHKEQMVEKVISVIFSELTLHYSSLRLCSIHPGYHIHPLPDLQAPRSNGPPPATVAVEQAISHRAEETCAVLTAASAEKSNDWESRGVTPSKAVTRASREQSLAESSSVRSARVRVHRRASAQRSARGPKIVGCADFMVSLLPGGKRIA